MPTGVFVRSQPVGGICLLRRKIREFVPSGHAGTRK